MKFKKIIKSFLVVIFAIIVFGTLAGVSFYYGYKFGVKNPEEIIVRGITNINDEGITADFGVFWQAWKTLKNEQLHGAEAKDSNLIYGAISGMTDSLKDPYTVFMNPEDSKKFEQDISGSFGGIGAEIGIRNDQLTIVSPLKDSPAEKAGLKSGDKILKIGDASTVGINVSEAIKLIRGPENTDVILTIFREGWEKSQDITITRQIIMVPTLDWKIIEMEKGDKTEKVAYIQLYSFNENVPPLFYEAAIKTLYNESKGMILDLRNDPGGFLEIAVNLAGWFLEKDDVVVSERFRSGETKVFRAGGNQAFKDMPMVILVNEGSASAAEIMAGALKDNRSIKLIGEKTFGKGVVQELRQLKDGSTLKITTAEWLMPSGTAIEKNGIMPDYEVKITDDDIKAKRDPQLEKALEVLAAEIKL